MVFNEIAKAVNNDSQVCWMRLIAVMPCGAILDDSPAETFGELRLHTNETDDDGIWARYSGWKFGNGNFDGGFNMYQQLADKALMPKAFMVLLLKMAARRRVTVMVTVKTSFAGSIYGTWHGDNSDYTDIVARFGQFDTDIRSYGDYPDKAKAKAMRIA